MFQEHDKPYSILKANSKYILRQYSPVDKRYEFTDLDKLIKYARKCNISLNDVAFGCISNLEKKTVIEGLSISQPVDEKQPSQ